MLLYCFFFSHKITLHLQLVEPALATEELIAAQEQTGMEASFVMMDGETARYHMPTCQCVDIRRHHIIIPTLVIQVARQIHMQIVPDLALVFMDILSILTS